MPTDLREHTVLVVDDAPDSLKLINDTLDRAGINTLVALEGKQALAIVHQLRPDMILMDALMPVMDGFETCQQLKADPNFADIPVIFMTGLSDSEHVVKGLEAGGVDYLTKPVNPDELLARIKIHLKNARLTSSAQQALDTVGQYIFTVNSAGQIVWATPQTHSLFAKAKITEAWKRQTLAAQLTEWLSHRPNQGQIFSLEPFGYCLQISLIEIHHDQDVLLKLREVKSTSGEERLRQALHLTVREAEVLFWLANGKTNKEIAQILGIGVRTVNKHLEQIFPKLGVENRTTAAGIAIRVLN